MLENNDSLERSDHCAGYEATEHAIDEGAQASFWFGRSGGGGSLLGTSIDCSFHLQTIFRLIDFFASYF